MRKFTSLTMALTMGLTLFSGSAKALDVQSQRVSGNSRYETSLKVSSNFDKSDYLILASGESYADALFGSTLSTQLKSPLLLTGKNTLPNGIYSEIKRLGVKEVFLLGGENTISKNIEGELLKQNVSVVRLAGSGRLETAKAIAEKRLSLAKENGKTVSEIKTGTDGYNFPDALVAGPFVGQYNKDGKIATLLPNIGSIDFEWYFGGKNSSAAIKYSGSNRYETAVSVANAYKSVLGKTSDTVVLVNGENYPDALSASSLSQKYSAPILLTPSKSVSTATQKFIKDNNIKKIIVVGGENSVNQAVLDTYLGKAPAPVQKKSTNTFTEATVTRVVDGDTVQVNVGGKEYKLRMVGIDTPETVHPKKPVQFYGKEASNYTKSQLTGKKVYLQKDVTETDKYGRLLRYIWLSRPSSNEPTKKEVVDMMFNAQLVKNGYAHSYTYPPDVKYIPIFRELEQNARHNGIGLWNSTAAAKFVPTASPTASKNTSTSKPAVKPVVKYNPPAVHYTPDTSNARVKGNRKSRIYHMPGDASYNRISSRNVVYFSSAAQAEAAGYKRAKR